MKTAKLLGLAFLAMLAINAIALTTTASAVLLTSILPIPTAEKPVLFTDKGGPGELVPLKEKLGGVKTVHCEKNTSKGEWTSEKLGKGEIIFSECTLNGVACTELSGAKTITAKGPIHVFTGLLGGKEVPALVVLPEHIHFMCGVVLFLILQETGNASCIAGEILEPNVLLKVVKVDFKEEKGTEGDQDIKKVWDTTDKEFTCQIAFNIGDVGLQDGAIVQIENEEELEGFKQGGVAVTVLLMF